VFSESDARLLSAIAALGGNALQRAHVLETLEQRVEERTQELAKANEQLQELDKLKDLFVSNVSHELRTPLTAIKLHLGLLNKRGAELLPRYLPVLLRETDRLHRLIEDLLNLSRIKSQPEALKRTWHNLDTLINEVIVLQSSRAEERGVNLQHQPNASVPMLWLDASQMLQVLNNLIGNAVLYSAAGGHITVSSQLLSSGELDGVELRVHNDGPAIPEEDLQHLFKRFYRGQIGQQSGESGTGLGLSISKEIVERHGGEIRVRSTEADGTTFSVWLPLTPEPARRE
jgi:signal transduction histidine kinase